MGQLNYIYESDWYEVCGRGLSRSHYFNHAQAYEQSPISICGQVHQADIYIVELPESIACRHCINALNKAC